MKQLNFSRRWPQVEPWLDHPDVKAALLFGLFVGNPKYRPDDPPWEEGRGPINGQRARQGKLSWYQPWGRCHSIAPFAWAVAQKLCPNLRWGFLTSEWHTVAVGLDGDEIELVADILLFKQRTAEQSVDFVKKQPWFVCFSPGEIFGPVAVEGWNMLKEVQSRGDTHRMVDVSLTN